MQANLTLGNATLAANATLDANVTAWAGAWTDVVPGALAPWVVAWVLVGLCPVMFVCGVACNDRYQKAAAGSRSEWAAKKCDVGCMLAVGLVGMLAPACLFVAWHADLSSAISDVPGAFALWGVAFALLGLAGVLCAMGFTLFLAIYAGNDDVLKAKAEAAKAGGTSYAKTARAEKLAGLGFAMFFFATPTLVLLFVGCLAAWRMLMSPAIDGHDVPLATTVALPAGLLGAAALCWCALGVLMFANNKDAGLEGLRAEAADIDLSVERGLADGTLRLLSGVWLRDGAAERISRRQDLPEGALLSPEAAASAHRQGLVLVLSYGWVQPGEPDPNGTYLRALRRLLTHMGRDAERCGVFWDYAALPQRRHVDGAWQDRTAAEEATFRAGLALMGKLYGSMWRTTVVQHKLLPARDLTWREYNGRAYEDRGWCCFEEGVAHLAAGHRSEANRGAALGWGPWTGKEQPKVLEISGFYPHVVRCAAPKERGRVSRVPRVALAPEPPSVRSDARVSSLPMLPRAGGGPKGAKAQGARGVDCKGDLHGIGRS